MVRAYLTYLFKAGNRHSLHSPFVFELYTRIIRADNPQEPTFRPIHSLRKELLANRQVIEVTDFGAGSRVSASRQRLIRDIARYSEKPARFGRLLFRLIKQYSRPIVFDLGTSLGLTTLYEAAAATDGKVISFEGCPTTAAVARRNFERFGYRNVELVVGNLDETLDAQVAATDRIDLAFFDANHRYEPTVRYFNSCLPKKNNDSCFIFDDIHWSKEMEQAWETIKAHPDVTLTIDLFYVGLVFFRRQQPKQHFVLRF